MRVHILVRFPLAQTNLKHKYALLLAATLAGKKEMYNKKILKTQSYTSDRLNWRTLAEKQIITMILYTIQSKSCLPAILSLEMFLACFYVWALFSLTFSYKMRFLQKECILSLGVVFLQLITTVCWLVAIYKFLTSIARVFATWPKEKQVELLRMIDVEYNIAKSKLTSVQVSQLATNVY